VGTYIPRGAGVQLATGFAVSDAEVEKKPAGHNMHDFVVWLKKLPAEQVEVQVDCPVSG